MPSSVMATRRLEKELHETKKKVSHLESLLEVIQVQVAKMNENGERRTDAFSKAISSLENDLRNQDLAQTKRLQKIESRLRNQHIVDGQVEALVDRFNMSLVQFENKLSSLQKVISEKEMTLISYRRVMEQIVDEVEKLKAKQDPRRSTSQFL